MVATNTSPRKPSATSQTRNQATVANPTSIPNPTIAVPPTLDPEALLDILDKRNQRRVHVGQFGPNGRAIPAKDESDSPPFDPIAFLNQHYESESVFTQQLPSLRDSVSRRMDVLNDRIAVALQRQADSAASTRRHVQDAKASCKELENRILQVREKAAASERSVLEITADMKRLDCAKRHLYTTITALKQLHLFVQTAENLRLQSSVTRQVDNDITKLPYYPDYKEAANSVIFASELITFFKPYTSKVQQMQLLCGKVMEYQENLRLSLVFGFRVVAFGREKALRMSSTTKKSPTIDNNEGKEESTDHEEAEASYPTMSLSDMDGGIRFIDALGADTRKEFIHNFCQDSLGDYLKEFEPPSRKAPPKQEEKRVSSFKKVEPKPVEPPTKSLSGLDQIEQRFAWFLNGPMLSIKSKFPNIFPSSWNIQACLVSMFLQLTRDHVLALLDGPRKDSDAANATVLLKALQKTILFEKDITAWLERECGVVFENTDDSDKVSSEEQVTNKPLIGMASIAFQNYMGPYIRLEEQSMNEQLEKALDDRTVDTRGERPVFISSTNLFVYIKGSITRCTALTKGYALLLLYKAFKKSLREYAQILNSKLPQPLTSQSAGVAGITFGAKLADKTQTNANASFVIPPGEEVTVCHVISTCEYCADTMEALEDLIKETIDHEYKGKIDMVSDQEQFHDITAKSIRILVSGLTNRLDVSLKEMSHTNWSAWDTVGEESPYIFLIHEQIEPFVKSVKHLLPTSYFRSFCDKFVIAFTMAFYDHLVRQKRISEPGTQQLLLDLYNLKTFFLKLPVLEDIPTSGKKSIATGGSIAPAMYTKIVQKQFGRMEIILKLVGTTTNLLVENFKAQWPGGTASDLIVVMSLKGMKRNEQASMLEKLGFDPVQAMKGVAAGVTSATIVSEHVQLLQDQGQTVAAKVNSDLTQMRQKVEEFRKTFR